MTLSLRKEEVTRYFVREDFNPGSPKQLLAYIKAKGFKPGYNYKTGSESTDSETLERLARSSPVFRKILDWREVRKIDNTYVAPNIARADAESRIHTQFIHAPSNMRLSSVEPNLQNIPDADDETALARRFRHCIIASPGHILVEADFAGIEAVLTGYFCGDDNLVRIGGLGVHSLVLSHFLGEPVDPDQDKDTLAAVLADIKARHKSSRQYRGCKVLVHASDYGGSPMAIYKSNQDVFSSLAETRRIYDIYLDLFPKLAPWWKTLRERAAKEHFLGGANHPFRYKHWFWDVTAWDPRRKTQIPGSDWNKVVAFYPASTAAGVLFESALRLTDPGSPHFVGDFYDGRTPLRSLIHDSILGEAPVPRLPDYIDRLVASMTLPVRNLPYHDSHLSFSVDVKIGRDWGTMKPLREV